MISVITSTRNSFLHKSGSLELMLNSLKMQAGAQDIELVVVDNASRDRTLRFLRDFRRSAPFKEMRIIENEVAVSNRSRSRNIACRAACGDFFLFIDDDVVLPDRRTLHKLRRFVRVNCFATGAARYWTSISWPRARLLEKILNGGLRRQSSDYFMPHGIKRETGYRDLFEYSFIANFGLVDRGSFLRVGGFDDEVFSGWGREDVDLMLRLYLNEATFLPLAKDIWVIHLNHPLRKSDAGQRSKSFEKYKQREAELGVVFKVNHLYGVFENDGTSVLENREGTRL